MNNYMPPGYMAPGDPQSVRDAYMNRQRVPPPDQFQMPTPPTEQPSTPPQQPGQFPQQQNYQPQGYGGSPQNYGQQQQVLWPAPPGATPGGSGQVTYPPNYGNTSSPSPAPQPQGTPKAVIVVGADGQNYVYDPNTGKWSVRPQGMR